MVTLVALIGSACGQFPQARRPAEVRAQPAAAVAAPASEAAPGPGTGGMPDSGPLAGDDGGQGPGGAAITGGKSNVSLSKYFRTSPRTTRKGGAGGNGTPGSGSGTGSTTTRPKSKQGSGSGKQSGARTRSGDRRTRDGARPGKPAIEGRVRQGAGPGGPPDLAQLISRETQRGAKYNSTVLPAGFPFLICPVQGRYSYSDDYGTPRYAGGYHPHAGNDIFAERGTPVVAPLDGSVERVPNTLGGLAVEVHGAQGYVYMAHLVGYGITDRRVPAGTVVGFVGNTGDAQGTATHDHFEWHPFHVAAYDRSIAGTNGAVDPFPYLQVVCPPN